MCAWTNRSLLIMVSERKEPEVKKKKNTHILLQSKTNTQQNTPQNKNNISTNYLYIK